MKFSPQILMAVLAVFAISVLALFYIQTSPEVTDQPPEPVVVQNVEVIEKNNTETENENATKAVSETPQVKDTPPPPPEASVTFQGHGINLARVRPDGSAIIAGQAVPGSVVNLMRDGQIIGSAIASDQGEWVIIPDILFENGSHLISVEMIQPDDTRVIGEMALAIEMLGSDEIPLVALVPYTEQATQTATVLQAPETIIPETLANEIAASEADQSDQNIIPRVTIRSIQALNETSLNISGLANGGASIDVSVNGVFAISSKPDDKSMYTAAFTVDKSQESFVLKSTLRDDEGQAIASAQIKLSQAQIAEGLNGNDLIVVQKGDALWRIAYKTYGAGIRYVDIVRQNPTKINDPDLIYPDQIFIIPNGDQ